jgi:hypothetical protein
LLERFANRVRVVYQVLALDKPPLDAALHRFDIHEEAHAFCSQFMALGGPEHLHAARVADHCANQPDPVHNGIRSAKQGRVAACARAPDHCASSLAHAGSLKLPQILQIQLLETRISE